VFAEGDSIARGALLPDGSVAQDSLAPTLQELPEPSEGTRHP
jgi:hypothetical protein